ncbi:radical SAM protein [Alkaliphilus transvaalensis]|uniref:radical SAM protein n=1 Tax=Alkaliphilus transvaalensis TaxID=114628 RepID=UPI00047D152F|nr:radical SAM protein [Alkaliphilus transvaalensis]
MTGGTYDLKVGYTCNNYCFHCVVEPNKKKYKVEHEDKSMDLTYGEIINLFNSSDFINSEQVTLTGGEITLRKDFMRIIKYIHSHFPKKRIAIQTNGRLLKSYVEEIKNMGANVFYVVALHSTAEDIHNRITDCKQVNGSPFKETWETLKEIKRVYGGFNKVARIEIVLSSLNLYNLPITIKELYENDICNIGVSYPHLDGFYLDDPVYAQKIGFSYGELKKVLPEVYRYAKERPNLYLHFEKVPACMWRDEKNGLLASLDNLGSMEHGLNENVTVTYPESTNNNFIQSYANMHKKAAVCSSCAYSKCCLGVWFESIEMFGEDGFTPITNEELNKGVA